MSRRGGVPSHASSCSASAETPTSESSSQSGSSTTTTRSGSAIATSEPSAETTSLGRADGVYGTGPNVPQLRVERPADAEVAVDRVPRVEEWLLRRAVAVVAVLEPLGH